MDTYDINHGGPHQATETAKTETPYASLPVGVIPVQLAMLLADRDRLAAEVARLTRERDDAQRALRNLLVGACVNEVARVRLAEHEHREAAVDRALGDAAELIGRMVLMPREPGRMQVGMNVRFAVETDGPKLGHLRRRLAALAPPKEEP